MSNVLKRACYYMCVRVRVRVVVVSSELYHYVLFYFSSVDGKEE